MLTAGMHLSGPALEALTGGATSCLAGQRDEDLPGSHHGAGTNTGLSATLDSQKKGKGMEETNIHLPPNFLYILNCNCK